MTGAVVFLFDTDHLGIVQRVTRPEGLRLAVRLAEHAPDDFYVSIISFHEQVAGWNTYIHRAKTREALVLAYRMFQEILADFAAMQVLPFDNAAAGVFASLRAQKVRIGTMDLRIAAIALARGFTVLSRNTVDFSRVPGLTVEDWTVP